MLAKIAEGIPVEGMESLAPRWSTRWCRSPTTCPRPRPSLLVAPSASVNRAMSLAETNREFLEAAWNAATAGAEAPIDLDSGDFLTVPRLR